LINYTKNSTSDNEIVRVKEWLRAAPSNDFKKYVMNEIAWNQVMAGKEASLLNVRDRGWEVNEHVKRAAELIAFIRNFDEYAQPEKELYKLELSVDSTLEDYGEHTK
jgi:hypothetical protein